MGKSPEEQAAAMIANLEASTGRSLDDWIALARAAGEEKHGAIVAYLKRAHGLTHGYANLVAHKTLESDAGSLAGEVDLVAAQYAGGKDGLRPIYDTLIAVVTAFGGVEIAPKKGYVSLRRSKQFALIQPSTRTRIDLGLALGARPPAGRLELSGSFNAMVSHRVRLSTPHEVDDEVAGWLREAWDRS